MLKLLCAACIPAVRKAANGMRITTFVFFEVEKINELVVTSNKLQFRRPLCSCLGPYVSRRPPAAQRWGVLCPAATSI